MTKPEFAEERYPFEHFALRWAVMPRAFKDRFFAFLLKGSSLVLVGAVLVVELVPSLDQAVFQAYGNSTAVTTGNDSLLFAIAAIVNAVSVALVLLGISDLLLARSTLRQFDRVLPGRAARSAQTIAPARR